MSSKPIAHALPEVAIREWGGPARILGRLSPFAIPFLLGGGFVLLQWRGVIERLQTESSLVSLALVSYISATVFYLLYLYRL